MMGLSNWVLVSTWFIKQLLFYLVPIIIMTLLLKVREKDVHIYMHIACMIIKLLVNQIYVFVLYNMFTVWGGVSKE